MEIVFDSNGKMFALVASQIQKKFQLIMRGKKFSLLIFDMDTSVKIDFKSFVVRMNFQNMLDFNKLMGRQLYCIESPRI